MSDTPILCPIKPHEMDKRLRNGLEDIAERVATNAFIHGRGKDLFLLIYIAGIYHGVELAKRAGNFGGRER